jgi:hypothetical protein
MDELDIKPRILLFDEFGKPLVVQIPPQLPKKQPIGFINGTSMPKKLVEEKTLPNPD